MKPTTALILIIVTVLTLWLMFGGLIFPKVNAPQDTPDMKIPQVNYDVPENNVPMVDYEGKG